MRSAVGCFLVVLTSYAAVTTEAIANDSWRCANPTAGQAAVCSWLWDVHSNGSLFVAVGQRGKLITSTDGFSWTDRVSGTDEHLNGVVHNGLIWVVTGDRGVILTSVDGAIWTAQSSGTTIRLAAVTWSSDRGLFVTVGGAILSSSCILTSPDGLNWTSRTSASSTDIRSVACDTTRCVAVGASGDIQTSSNAMAWALIPPQATGANLNGVASSGSLFVIAAQGSSYGGPYILTSPDGTTWTQRENGSKNLKDVIWSGNQFVAVGTMGTSYTSEDGITWTQRFPGGSRELMGVTFDGSTYVTVGNVAVKTSANGHSWTNRLNGDIPYLNMALNAVVRTGAQYIAVGHDGVLLTSPDGLSWVEQDSVSYRDLFGIALGAGSQFNYAVSAESGRVYTSDDLETWTERITETSKDLQAIASNGFRFVAVGSTGAIQTSSLGDVWTTATSPTTNRLNSVTWIGSHFVAVGYGGTVLTSTDGTVWTEQAFPSSAELLDVIWDGSQLIASAQTGQIALSANGISWTINTVGPDPPRMNLYGVHTTEDSLIAVGALGYVLASNEATAVPWTEVDLPFSTTFKDVGGSSETVVAVGEAGVVVTSIRPIFMNGFESGDLSGWSAWTP